MPTTTPPSGPQQPHRSRGVLLLASGGTVLAAVLFLVSGILTLHVSLPIGAALVGYAVLVAAVAWAGGRGASWAVGAMTFLALLHACVAASMLRGDRMMLVLLLASLVTLAAAARLHLADLRRRD